MPSSDYIPGSDADLCALLAHVRDTLPQYYTTLNITAATPEVSIHLTDTIVFTCLCNRQTVLLQSSQGATREHNRARCGDKDNPNVPTNLTWPIGPAVPSPVMPSIEARFMGYLGNEASVTFENRL